MVSADARFAINCKTDVARLARQPALTRQMTVRLGVWALVNGNQRLPFATCGSASERAGAFRGRAWSEER